MLSARCYLAPLPRGECPANLLGHSSTVTLHVRRRASRAVTRHMTAATMPNGTVHDERPLQGRSRRNPPSPLIRSPGRPNRPLAWRFLFHASGPARSTGEYGNTFRRDVYRAGVMRSHLNTVARTAQPSAKSDDFSDAHIERLRSPHQPSCGDRNRRSLCQAVPADRAAW